MTTEDIKLCSLWMVNAKGDHDGIYYS